MTATLATDEFYGNVLVWSGGASDDNNEVPIQTADVTQYNTFLIMSTAGAMDVAVNFGVDTQATPVDIYSVAPLSLTDMGAAASAPVIVSVANRIYGFKGYFRKIRIIQNGATGVANATLICGRNLFR